MPNEVNIGNLDAAIKAVCPIDGISIGTYDDRSTWRIDYTAEATDDQRAKAKSILMNYVEPDEILSYTGAQLRDALTDAQSAALDKYLSTVKSSVRDYWISGYRNDIPINGPKIKRIASGAGIDLNAWFAAVK